MDKLELKIPPLLLVVICAGLMWLAAQPGSVFQGAGVALPVALRASLFALLALVGFAFAVSGVLSFKRANTTLNPTAPHSASSLVTTGIYTYTRNPMYLGFLFFLLGWGLFLANVISLLLVAGFVAYMGRFQIEPEERALVRRFEADFLAYRAQVRRWL